VEKNRTYHANETHVVTPTKPPGFTSEWSMGRQFGMTKRANVEKMCVKDSLGRSRFCVVGWVVSIF
jgi:hypothetical protein